MQLPTWTWGWGVGMSPQLAVARTREGGVFTAWKVHARKLGIFLRPLGRAEPLESGRSSLRPSPLSQLVERPEVGEDTLRAWSVLEGGLGIASISHPESLSLSHWLSLGLPREDRPSEGILVQRPCGQKG